MKFAFTILFGAGIGLGLCFIALRADGPSTSLMASAWASVMVALVGIEFLRRER